MMQESNFSVSMLGLVLSFALGCNSGGGEISPIVGFTASPVAGTTRVQFSSTSSGATTLEWDFSGEGVSSTTDLIYDFLTCGAFDVTLVATRDGISSTMTKTVVVSAPVTFSAEQIIDAKQPRLTTLSWGVDQTTCVDHFDIFVNDGVSGAKRLFLEGDMATVSGSLMKDATQQNIVLSLALTDFVLTTYQIVARDIDDMEIGSSADVPVSGIIFNDLIGYLKASNTGAGDRFGVSVDVSDDGHTIAIGALDEEDSQGAVYVFVQNVMGSWSQQAKLKAENAATNDFLGYAVSLSADGDTLVVGAPRKESDDNSAPQAGAVYVYDRAGEIWAQTSYVTNPFPVADDLFGTSVSVSANGMQFAVGVPKADGKCTGLASSDGSGVVRLFNRTSTSSAWSPDGCINTIASDTDAGGGRFGMNISLSGDGLTIAVGIDQDGSSTAGIDNAPADPATSANNQGAPTSGAVEVYRRAGGGNWNFEAYIKPNENSEADSFGISVSLTNDGNTLAVGALAAALGGGVYTFERAGNIWSQVDGVITGMATAINDGFGSSVALSADGSTLAVGVQKEDFDVGGICRGAGTCPPAGATASAEQSGAVYLYRRDESSFFVRAAYIKAPNPLPRDHLGGKDVRIFFQVGGSNDFWSVGVALSADGSLLVVGAPLEDDDVSRGIDSPTGTVTPDSEAGAAFIY